MSNEIILSIRGVSTTLSELRADVDAAKAKGLAGQFAFMPETVEALLDCIKELQSKQLLDKPAEVPNSTLEGVTNITSWFSLATLCENYLKADPQFAVRYVDAPFSTDASKVLVHNTSHSAHALRVIGNKMDYRTIMIHVDDIQCFVDRVRESKKY